MILTALELMCFRNHRHNHFDLHSMSTFFYGKNGAGKTNILEAIYFLAYAKSYRSSDASKLIQHDAGSAGIHASFIDDNEIEHTMSAVITGKKKDLSLTKKK